MKELAWFVWLEQRERQSAALSHNTAPRGLRGSVLLAVVLVAGLAGLLI
ncbi:MAG: hypothetical protein ACK5YW_12375 [Betaproteobacteria bacterium]|jgi:hypothetical protein|nr:hypothetical protein [Rhodocyclaceae bacterium]MCA3133123.1 hypothetical protein [Rhodocyclaceae bacterium]MCA3141798.1 hypothetical protein [Rhodocyclaceae bacterium]MCA3144706.1 hypothetical protein [Rhodocyclaceae bacterium]MCE2896714.1 hypothetical protein [Betaproteobacteria bacterium]